VLSTERMRSAAMPGGLVEEYNLSRKPGAKVFTELARIERRVERRPVEPRPVVGMVRERVDWREAGEW
jgi:hypothetical protein